MLPIWSQRFPKNRKKNDGDDDDDEKEEDGGGGEGGGGGGGQSYIPRSVNILAYKVQMFSSTLFKETSFCLEIT